jgi:hypothetical protein
MKDDKSASFLECFMGIFASTFIFILAVLFIPVTSTAVEAENAEYKHTILTLENLDNQSITATVSREVQQNDHTARVMSDTNQKNLYIIHHKSLSIKELEAIITSHPGISINAVSQHNYQPALSQNPDTSVRAIRGCGATKETWKKLLRKYFQISRSSF